MQFGDTACVFECKLDCECCCFVWDAEQLADMEVLCTFRELELKQQAGGTATGGPVSYPWRLCLRVFIKAAVMCYIIFTQSTPPSLSFQYSCYIRFLFRSTCSSIFINYEEVQENCTLERKDNIYGSYAVC